MPLFAYRARDQRGILITGQMEGIAVNTVKNMLGEQGLIPLQVKPAQSKGSWFPKLKIFKKVKQEELVLTTRQFHTLFQAGMGMETILSTLQKQTKNKTLKEALQRIQTDIAQGSTLAKAFGKHPDIFDDLYVHMLEAGEQSGILDKVLKNLGDLLQKEIEIKQGVKSATLYPKIVLTVLTMATLVMLIWVIPEFSKFYGHYKATLPLPTRILTGASDLIRYYGWVVALFVAGGFLSVRRYYQTPRGRFKIDQLKWQIPIFGSLSQKIANARFAHLLSALYQSGLSITKSLSLVETVIENEVMARDIRSIRAHIEKGQTISKGMQETQSFSPILIEATSVGEKAGSLDTMLEGLGQHYDTEIQHTTKNLTTLLEPFLLFFIFGMVALFALAIFLPIWNLSQAVMH